MTNRMLSANRSPSRCPAFCLNSDRNELPTGGASGDHSGQPGRHVQSMSILPLLLRLRFGLTPLFVARMLRPSVATASFDFVRITIGFVDSQALFALKPCVVTTSPIFVLGSPQASIVCAGAMVLGLIPMFWAKKRSVGKMHKGESLFCESCSRYAFVLRRPSNACSATQSVLVSLNCLL
jgi:hypothetical protein